MPNKSKLKTDPLLFSFVLVVLGIGALLHYRGDIPPTIPVAATPPAVQPASSVPPAALAASAPVAQASGHIVFENSFFDFGTVVEGDIVKHTFKFKNDGADKVKIVKTETSCGCTTASGALKEYAPGETGELEVAVDTRDKKGIVVKTVTVTLENDAAATAELTLTMKLQPPPHPKIGNIRNINTEAACKTCHLESGAGQSGVFLYHRVCAQCHGKKGAGGFGRAFNDARWQKVNDAYIKKMIRAGLPAKGMPSFVDGVTPPLTEEQVTSLIEYIRGLAPH